MMKRRGKVSSETWLGMSVHMDAPRYNRRNAQLDELAWWNYRTNDLGESAEQYKQQVERVTGFAERVHIDLSDGEFAPTFTVGVSELWAPEGWLVDVHVMANDLTEYVPKLIALRPNLIIICAEAKIATDQTSRYPCGSSASPSRPCHAP